MADLARVGIEWESRGFDKGERDLNAVAKASDRAEQAANRTSTATKRSSSVMAGAANDARTYASATERLAAEQEAAIKTANRLNAAHGSAVQSSKSLQYATLNLGRQFSDVGVSLASGMNPLMVLVQQGPQIGEIFATLKTEGIGAGAAFRSMGAALAPALPLILGIGAAVGVVVGAFALFERAVDKETKHATTFGDTWKATLKVTGDYIMDGPIGDGLKWLGKAFNTTLDVITGVVAGGAVKIAGFFGASYLAIVNNWKRLPEVVGVILQNAANAAIKATEWLINKGIDGINALGKNFGFAQIGKVALGTFKSASVDIAKQFDADQKRIEAATVKGMKEFMSKVAAEADKNFEKRQKASKGAAKATEDHTKAILANNDAYRAGEDALTSYLAKLNEEIATMGMSAEQLRRRQAEQMALAADTPQIAEFIRQVSKMYEDQARVGKEAAEAQKAIGAAANDNIRVFDALGVVIPTAMENAAYELERAANEARNFRYDIEDVAYAINNNDWTSAFAGLAKVLANVEKAFKTATTAKEKYSAVAMLAQGVGGAIGGTGGAVVGGAGSGALAGLSAGSALTTLGLAVPGPGWALAAGGAVLGAIGGLFGSSKAKKQQRAQEAAQRAAEEAARQQQISDTTFSLNVALLEAQGKAEEALAMTRQRELDALAKLDPALVALQQQLYAAEDAASAAAKEAEAQAQALQKEIAVRQTQRGIMLQLMALDDAVTGGNSAVLAARQDELAALDPVSRQLKEIYYARLDEGEALAKQAAAVEAATKAQEEAAQVAEAFQQANIGLMRQLMAMDDAVLGTTSARDAARADELAKLDETGRKLQTIIWARQDEAEVIAKQQAATEAATAAAEEAARKTAELLKQRTDLENQLLVAIGMTALATERQRTAMLDSLDPSLRGYQTLLYGVEDATAAVTAAESALADARSAASQAYEREASALQATIDKFKSFSAAFKSIGASLTTGPMAALNPTQLYARTQADFARVADRIAMGDTEALGDVQSVIEANLAASEKAQATNVGYLKDVSAAKRLQEAALKLSDKQVDQGSAQLAALQSQVSALGILNQSTLSVGQAVTNVAAAIDALARATSAKSAAEAAAKNALSNAGVIPKASQSIAIAANDNADLAAAKAIYLSATGGISSELFNRYVGSNPFATFNRLGYEGDPEALRKKYGFATGGSFTVGGSGPPDSQVFPLHLSPGEMVNVSRPGESGNAELVAELRALRQEVAELKAAQIQTTINTGKTARATQSSADVLDAAARGGVSLSVEAA